MARTQWALFGAAFFGMACSSNAVDQTPRLTAVEQGGGTGTGGSGSGCEPFCTGGGGEGPGVGGRNAFGVDGGGVCVGEAHSIEVLPADLYVMFDQSSSMSDPLPDGTGTWWGAAQAAVKRFVNDPRASGMNVGIQYFPLDGVEPASCTAHYETPDVELAPLPGNAAAIGASVDAHAPSTFTPTGPALSGAIQHMKAWAGTHPGRAPIVVLVTDGFPTECDPRQITDIAALAKTAFETDPPVWTFVVGFNLGQDGENLRTISEAGGSGEPFLISDGDVGAAFTEALLGISGKPLECNLPIPEPSDPKQTLDPNLVLVRYTSNSTGVTEELPKLNGLGDCNVGAGVGWYYDSPAAPKEIELCKNSCKKLASGVVETVFGCRSGSGAR
ncbi:MAG TPA: vWA domain-containing protein [Polyangiaceae bacterium]|nr:vWA domain-containing protein [Polyangiaceae bacterium]